MASNAVHAYNIELPCDLKIPFLNNPAPRSKRDLEETEEISYPEGKRSRHTDSYGLSALHHRSSPVNGVAPSPVSSLPTHGCCDADDSLLEPSSGEELDSPTGLSPEAEDRLLSDSSVDGLELGPGLQRLKNNQGFAQLLKSLKRTVCSEPPALAVISPREAHAADLSPGDPLSKGVFPMGTGSGFNRTPPPHAVQEADAFLNPQKGRDLSGVRDEEAAQVIGEKNGQVGRSAPTSKLELSERSTSNGPRSTEGDSRTPSLQQETATPVSGSVSDQRKSHMEEPVATEPNRRPRRIFIHETDLEAYKKKYISDVLAHANGKRVISEVNELHKLIQSLDSKNQRSSCQHTTDLTVRNYAKRNERPDQRFSLPEWVEKNGGKLCRFASIPDHFQRSPIPS